MTLASMEQSAAKVKDAMEWRAKTKEPLNIGLQANYAGYRDMTAREVCIAIGWDRWPIDWPKL